ELDEDGGHAGKAEDGKVGLLDAPVFVTRKGFEHPVEDSRRHELAPGGSGKVEDLHAFGCDGGGGVGVDADEEVGVEPVCKGSTSRQAQGAVLLPRENHGMAELEQLVMEEQRYGQGDVLFLESKGDLADGAGIRAAVPGIDADNHLSVCL